MVTIKRIHVGIAVLLLQSSWASASLNIRAERSMEGGSQQMALIFTDKEVRFVSNANFIGEPETEARLGSFKADLDPNLKTVQMQIEQILKRVSTKNLVSEGSPHRVRIYIGDHEIDTRSEYGEALRNILAKAKNITKWTPVKAVLIARTQNGEFTQTSITEKSNSKNSNQLQCHQSSEEFVCPVPNWGTAYLESK